MFFFGGGAPGAGGPPPASTFGDIDVWGYLAVGKEGRVQAKPTYRGSPPCVIWAKSVFLSVKSCVFVGGL